MRFWIYGCDEVWDVGILEFGDRWDLKRKMKIGEEKTKTREIEESKIEKNESKDMAVVGSDWKNEWIVKIKIIILYN